MINRNRSIHAMPNSRRADALILLCLLCSLAATAPQADTTRVHSVDHVDLQRYTGRWYEIARLPNRFQKHCSGDVVASYALRSDDRIDVTNVCRRDDGGLDSVMGVARHADSSSTARLQVRFAPAWLSWLWLVWGDYWVLDLDADYQTSLVGTPNHDYL